MTDHKPYILNTLSRAVETAAESRAKKSSPKAWKAIKDVAPTWPIYDANTLPYEVLTAWDVAKRVAIDDIIKKLIANLYDPDPDSATSDTSDKTPLKSVADV